jgi:hypothetical protein
MCHSRDTPEITADSIKQIVCATMWPAICSPSRHHWISSPHPNRCGCSLNTSTCSVLVRVYQLRPKVNTNGRNKITATPLTESRAEIMQVPKTRLKFFYFLIGRGSLESATSCRVCRLVVSYVVTYCIAVSSETCFDLIRSSSSRLYLLLLVFRLYT